MYKSNTCQICQPFSNYTGSQSLVTIKQFDLSLLILRQIVRWLLFCPPEIRPLLLLGMQKKSELDTVRRANLKFKTKTSTKTLNLNSLFALHASLLTKNFFMSRNPKKERGSIIYQEVFSFPVVLFCV